MKTNNIAALALIFVFLTFNNLSVISQPGFETAIGGTENDRVFSVIQTSDGGYAAAGYTESYGAGEFDMYIVKLNSSGTLQWSKTVGGTDRDLAFSMTQTMDGGYVMAGYTGTEVTDMYIVKLNSNGTFQWGEKIGGQLTDIAYSVVRTTDGGFAIAGWTNSFGAGGFDMYIVKFDVNGAIQWSRTIGGVNNEVAHSIIQTADGGFAVAGTTGDLQSYYSDDVLIIKLDASGTLQWSRTIGVEGQGSYAAYSIIQTSDGGYAAAGYTPSLKEGALNMHIVKLNSSGTLQWTTVVGGTDNDAGYSIIQTADGGYVVAGTTWSFSVNHSYMYIVKLNGSGTLQWSKTIGGTYMSANSIIQTSDGGFAIGGDTYQYSGTGIYDICILKLDSNFNTCGNNTVLQTSTSAASGTTTSYTLSLTSPTPAVTAQTSSTISIGTIRDLCLVGIKSISNEIPDSYKLYQNYPNPFNPATMIQFSIPKTTSVKIDIYDAKGSLIETIVNDKYNAGIYEVNWNAAQYPSGAYFYRIKTDEYTETKKMVLIK